MKIAEYNDMMSYLTRPPKPKMQVADKGLGERPFNASNGGSPMVPKPKPAEDPLEVFKKKSDLFLQGSFGSSDKTFFNNLIEQEYDKALDAGVLPEEAISFLKERSEMYRKLAEEGRMQGEPATLGPSYGRENKAIGGGVIEGEDLGTREGFANAKFNDPSADIKVGDDLGQGISQDYKKADGTIMYRSTTGKTKEGGNIEKRFTSFKDAQEFRSQNFDRKSKIKPVSKLPKDQQKLINKWLKDHPGVK